MATTLREFLIKLGVDADEKKVKRFDQALESVKETASGVFKWLKRATVAAGGLAAGLLANVANVGQYAAELDRTSKSLGMTTDELQELHHVARRFDVTEEMFNEALVQMTGRLGELRDGTGEAGEKLKLVGLNAGRLSRMKPAEMFEAFADGVARTKDETKQITAVTGVFGDNLGERVLPMLRLGSSGIAKLRKEAHALGVVMSVDQVKAGKKFNDQWKRFSEVTRSLRNQLALALLPKLTEAGEAVLDWVMANREWINAKIDDAVEKLGDAWDWLKGKLEDINDFVEEKLGGWDKVFARIESALATGGILFFFTKLFSVIQLVSTAWGVLAGILGGATFGTVAIVVAGIVAQLTLVYLVIDDIMTYFRGGDSVTGRFLEWARTSDGVVGDIYNGVSGVLELLKELALYVGDQLSTTFEALGIIAEPIFDEIQEAAESLWKWLKENLGPYIGQISDWFSGIGDSARKVAGALRSNRELGESDNARQGALVGARMIADDIREWTRDDEKPARRAGRGFGPLEAVASARQRESVSNRRAFAMSSADRINIQTNVTTNATADQIAAAQRRELEARDLIKRQQAKAIFAGGED